jgi:hypothetical protein
MAIIKDAGKIRGIISELTEKNISGVVRSLPTSAIRDHIRLLGSEPLLVRAFIVDQVENRFVVNEHEGNRWTVGLLDKDGVMEKSWSNVVHNESVRGAALIIQHYLRLEQQPRFIKSIEELTATAKAKERKSGYDKKNSADQKARDYIVRKIFESEVGRLVYHTRRIAKLTECVLEMCGSNCFVQSFQNPSTGRINNERFKQIPILPF